MTLLRAPSRPQLDTRLTAARRPSEPQGRREIGRTLAGQRILVDCRWLGLGGAGRVTELLLKAFQASPPPGEWILWGPEERVRPLAFPGATVRAATGNPLRLAGQADVLRVPAADVGVYLHQIRPLRPGPSVTAIHDTIPLRYGGGRLSRLLKRAFFVATARLTTVILTGSKFSHASIVRDLGVPDERILMHPYPCDRARAVHVAAMRDALGQEDRLVYVGRFAAHKNLERLCRAYARSEFARRGGRLALVGGWNGETEALQGWVDRFEISGVEIRPACTEEDMDRLLATSRALVLPSLEEGFGLPAYEAAGSGLPVAASRTGAMTELPPERAVLFDPFDEVAMQEAIDEAVSRPAGEPAGDEEPFADAVLAACARALDGSRA